jgi:hypothetical protein
MIRRKIGHLMVASAFSLAMLSAGSTAAFATDTTAGTDLANDVHAGETGEKTTANDVDTAEEVDEDGAIDDVDELEVGNSAAAESQS